MRNYTRNLYPFVFYCSRQVSYEEFKLQFAQMYEHYEKHRTDNITDPELRQSRPISTISGWDQEREENGIQPQIQQSQQVQTVPTEELEEREDDEQELKPVENGVAERERTPQKTIISSISDVYNKEISGDTDKASPAKESETSKLTDILEEQLGNPEQESQEIAAEIVEEILQKSEKLLDECKKASDDLLSQQQDETPVIKDEEIEQAVHEVAEGVRQIQLKAADVEKSEDVKNVAPVDDTKTDTEASAIISDESKQSTAESDEQQINGERIEGDGETNEKIQTSEGKATIEAVIDEIIDESVVKAEAIVEQTRIENFAENAVKSVEENVPEKPAEIAPESDKIIEIAEAKEDESKPKLTRENSEEIEVQVKEVIDNIIDDAVKEVEQQQQQSDENNEPIVAIATSKADETAQGAEAFDEPTEIVKETTESDVVNNNIVETVETPEPDIAEAKIHFSASNDSALPSSLSDDSPINDNKTNNSSPSPTASNDQHMDEHQNSDGNMHHDEANPDVQHKRQKSSSSRPMFSPGPTRPPFRIPEFKWSYIHQRLLSDVLFSLETDIQVWRSHSTKSVLDFVNSAENAIFVVNTVHLISQLADNLIIACGGLLPLLASATSPNSELDVLEPTQGMPLDVAVSFLQRLVNMADVLIFASSLNFGELEAEKNMSSGGILRQCLRLVSTCAVRNCLECKERTRGMYSGGSMRDVPGGAHLQALIRGAQASPKNIVDSLTGPMSPVKDPEKLLQDMDVNRLRAVIYRDVVSIQSTRMKLSHN